MREALLLAARLMRVVSRSGPRIRYEPDADTVREEWTGKTIRPVSNRRLRQEMIKK